MEYDHLPAPIPYEGPEKLLMQKMNSSQCHFLDEIENRIKCLVQSTTARD